MSMLKISPLCVAATTLSYSTDTSIAVIAPKATPPLVSAIFWKPVDDIFMKSTFPSLVPTTESTYSPPLLVTGSSFSDIYKEL